MFDDYETDLTYEIKIETRRFYTEKDEEIGTAHLRLEKADLILPIDTDSKIYIMPADFKKQMEANRKGCHVMIGLKSSEYPYLFIAQGDSKILVCPVRSEDDIKIKSV